MLRDDLLRALRPALPVLPEFRYQPDRRWRRKESEVLAAIMLKLQTLWLDLSNARMILHPKPSKLAGTILRYLEGLVVVKQKL